MREDKKIKKSRFKEAVVKVKRSLVGSMSYEKAKVVIIKETGEAWPLVPVSSIKKEFNDHFL